MFHAIENLAPLWGAALIVDVGVDREEEGSGCAVVLVAESVPATRARGCFRFLGACDSDAEPLGDHLDGIVVAQCLESVTQLSKVFGPSSEFFLGEPQELTEGYSAEAADQLGCDT